VSLLHSLNADDEAGRQQKRFYLDGIAVQMTDENDSEMWTSGINS